MLLMIFKAILYTVTGWIPYEAAGYVLVAILRYFFPCIGDTPLPSPLSPACMIVLGIFAAFTIACMFVIIRVLKTWYRSGLYFGEVFVPRAWRWAAGQGV